MQVEISLFLGILFAGYLASILIVNYVQAQNIIDIDKKGHLKKRKCEICFSSHFVSISFKYWRCPLCQSINREGKDDYRNRDSRG